jgi:hyperosmotically inducible periplasmic protein
MNTKNEYKPMRLTNRACSIIFVSAVLGLAGCQQEGTAEKAGQEIDEAAEKAGEALEDTRESAGEKVEEAGEALGD